MSTIWIEINDKLKKDNGLY